MSDQNIKLLLLRYLTAAARAYIGHFYAYTAGLKDLADRQFREAFGEE